MLTPRALVVSTVVGALTTVAGSTWIIHRGYRAALQREIDESTGQVGQLRAQADALRVEQEARRREIEAIRADIATAEAALATAKREAEESRCHATHARIDAAVTVQQVQCYQQFAEQAACSAANERRRADNTLFGAIVGAGLAVATGGSSLLLTAGGGLVGAGTGGGSCPAPKCVLDRDKLRRRVLAEQGIKRLPACTSDYEPQFLIEPRAGAPGEENWEDHAPP